MVSPRPMTKSDDLCSNDSGESESGACPAWLHPAVDLSAFQECLWWGCSPAGVQTPPASVCSLTGHLAAQLRGPDGGHIAGAAADAVISMSYFMTRIGFFYCIFVEACGSPEGRVISRNLQHLAVVAARSRPFPLFSPGTGFLSGFGARLLSTKWRRAVAVEELPSIVAVSRLSPPSMYLMSR